MIEIPPIPAPKEGDRFLNGLMECTVTSVWKSRFGDWKVSFKDSAKGGGIINLEYFNERFEIIGQNKQIDPDPNPVNTSAECECKTWCQTGGKILASHHRNCRHYDLEGDCHKLIVDLLRGIECSAQDTDGIHPALWEAYKRAKAAVWEVNWIDEE